jgi:DNA-binding PadR family transcriptional regulator
MSNSKIVEKLRKRIVKNFIDILVLIEMKKRSMSGYDVMRLVHKRFDTMVSPGTIYNLLYSLERDGFIKGIENERKRIYTLTEQGEQSIEVITEANKDIQDFLRARIS